MKIEILTKDPLYVLRDSNCITIGKRAIRENISKMKKREEYEYFFKCFMARHSTIETLNFRVVDENCRGDIANQIVRATKGHPRFQVQSSRPDWNKGEPRKPSDQTFRMFASVWTPLSWLQMCEQRLCANAQTETRVWVKRVLNEMLRTEDPFFMALADCSVPQCVYRGCICYELKPCGQFPTWKNKI